MNHEVHIFFLGKIKKKYGNLYNFQLIKESYCDRIHML